MNKTFAQMETDRRVKEVVNRLHYLKENEPEEYQKLMDAEKALYESWLIDTGRLPKPNT